MPEIILPGDRVYRRVSLNFQFQVSLNRGKGQDRQSAPLQLEHIFDMDPNRFVSKDTGPVDTVRNCMDASILPRRL